MSQKTIIAQVYGKAYTLACDVGQEQHLQGLIQEVNTRAFQLEKAVGRLPESLMLLYTALMISDELYDAKRDNARMRDELARMRRQLDEASGDDTRLAALEEEVAKNIYSIAARIEGMADKLAA